MNKMKLRNGFSLIELTVSLIITGIVIMAVMSTMTGAANYFAAIKTETRLKKAVETLSANVTTRSSTNYVLDLRLPDNVTGNNLLIEKDGYGKDIIYYPATRFTTGNISICATEGSGLEINIERPGEDMSKIKDVAFVVVSPGQSGIGVKLDKLPPPSTSSKLIFDYKLYGADPQFKYVTVYELREKLGCPPNDPLRIITDELAPIEGDDKMTRNIIYSNSINKRIAWSILASSPQEKKLLEDNVEFFAAMRAAASDYWVFPRYPDNFLPVNLNRESLDRVEGSAIMVSRKAGYKPGTYKFTVFATDTANFFHGNQNAKTFTVTFLD